MEFTKKTGLSFLRQKLAGFTLFLMTGVSLALTGGAVQAQQMVTLLANGGGVELTGELQGIKGGYYFLEVQSLGTMKIKIDMVDCVEGCDWLNPVAPNFGIYGSRTVGTTLIPNLLRGYAESIGASYELVETDDAAERMVILTNSDGSLRAEIDLQTRGSGSAFTALADGSAEIGIADRRMKDSDVAKFASVGLPDLRDTENEMVLGLDGIVLITHPDNPVRNLTSLEISKIWAGEITNWLELGRGNVPITVNSFGEGSGDRAVMLDALVRPNGREEMAGVQRWGAYQDMVDAVMADRGGIGFVGRWLARTNDVNLLAIRETCGLLSPPTDFRMKIEGYRLSRRLYAYTRPGAINPEAQAFLEWTRSKAAQKYVKESNFIDHELERMRLEDMGMMLIHTAAVEPDFNGAQYSDMMRALRGADRLSVSFRFNPGSSVLDVESIRNIEELAKRMDAGAFEGMEVLLVGFADSIGRRTRNTRLAQDRANAVNRILTDSLQPGTVRSQRVIPLSYGELLPLSCNDTEVGRARNRRVEVWLRLPDSRSTLR